jgi:hypothetical protein
LEAFAVESEPVQCRTAIIIVRRSWYFLKTFTVEGEPVQYRTAINFHNALQKLVLRAGHPHPGESGAEVRARTQSLSGSPFQKIQNE